MNFKQKKVNIIDKQGNVKNMNLKLKEITTSDLNDLISIYDEWKTYSEMLSGRGYRKANFPEGVSEDLVCILNKYYKLDQKTVYGCSTSFDCFDGTSGERIQVKASSTENELTSFGPNSVYDKVYFLDFYYEDEEYNRKFKIYEINITFINDALVNADETVTQQSEDGKRPRIKMRKLIEKHSISFDEYQITSTSLKEI